MTSRFRYHRRGLNENQWRCDVCGATQRTINRYEPGLGAVVAAFLGGLYDDWCDRERR
jgi:hypothetical protein